MTITVELSDEISHRLEELARSMNIDPSELARIALEEWASRSSPEVEKAGTYILDKHRELLRRLAQ